MANNIADLISKINDLLIINHLMTEYDYVPNN
jgi:hypothetical protein